MEISSIDIRYHRFNKFTSADMDKERHIKQLPYLSAVQSAVGSYSIRLDNDKQYDTGEGGFFIAPSVVTQDIVHNNSKSKGLFSARYIIIDVVINDAYHIDDVFDFPTVPDAAATAALNAAFDKLESAADACEYMCSLYRIVKILLSTATEKSVFRNSSIYPLMQYISENYMNDITVADMAKVMHMSEPRLYSVFKKATGTSPMKYVMDYRLSLASCRLLSSEDSVGKIASDAGFYDQFYFSKKFKSKYKISPGQYRKSCR